jgi:hypothetical protein
MNYFVNFLCSEVQKKSNVSETGSIKKYKYNLPKTLYGQKTGVNKAPIF